MQNLDQVLEQNKTQYLRHLQELVALDTHCLGHGIDGGLEKAGQDYLIELFKQMQADEIRIDPMNEAIIQDAIKTHNEGNAGHNQAERYNVHARFKGSGGPSLLFNGHMDTMPAGDESEWTSPPHAAELRDGKLYGLGSTDMKGGLMAAVMALKLLQDAGEELPGDVIISSVCDEEGGGNGSIQAAMQGIKADGVVVCECSADELILAHMGFVFFRVSIKGKAVHSGGKWKGVSAIDKAVKIMAALNELEHNWLLRYKHPLLPAPNLNVGVIKGGTAGSTVAGDCLFETCVHYLPEVMSYHSVVEAFKDAVARVAQADPWLSENAPEIEIYQAGGAFEQSEDEPLVERFKEAYTRVYGKTPPIVGSPAGCDSRTWKNIAGCPTIQFGPGHLEQCHAVDEFLDVEEYFRCIKVYAELIMSGAAK